MKTIPEALIRQQEAKKERTLEIIQNVIDALKEEGTIVTKKLLIELSGFSAATFSKPHVKELLQRNEVCQFRPKTTTSSKHTKQNNLNRKYEQLEKKYNLLNDELLNKDLRISALETDLEEERDKNKRLIGKIHEIMRKAEMNGIKF